MKGLCQGLCQVGYTSEWALVKFFSAMEDSEILDCFALKYICGKEESIKDAKQRLLYEVGERRKNLSETLDTENEWRAENIMDESINALKLLKRLYRNEIKYVQLQDVSNSLPLSIYENRDVHVVCLFTPNPTHFHYIEDAFKYGKHVLCEKPLVPVIDIEGVPDRRNLDGMKKLNEERQNHHPIGFDAEHYSAKKAAKIFFDKIGEMVKKYGKITKIEGYLEEKDDPSKERTKFILSRKNQTGLLTDTGVHLFSMITNIGGEVKDIESAEYGIYPGYDVETYTHVDFKASGDYFDGNIPCSFSVEKFIHKLKEPKERERKEFVLEFENGATVTVNFSKGRVTDNDGKEWEGRVVYSGNEYVNILKDLNDAISNREEPITSFTNSIKNLDAIYRTLKDFKVEGNTKEVYRENV